MPVSRLKISEFLGVIGQCHEIEKRVLNGSLPPDKLKPALQRIIEGDLGEPELFVSLYRQIQNIRRWNEERNWGLDEALEKLPHPPVYPDTIDHELTGIPVLVPYLKAHEQVSGTSRTLRELWSVVAHRNSGAYRERVSPEEIKQHLGLDTVRYPDLRWEVIDLGANRNRSLKDVRDKGALLPGAGILAAAAHFPEWIRRMDGEKIPFVMIPGWEQSDQALSGEVLYLTKPKRIPAELCLISRPEPRYQHNIAIPVITEIVQADRS